LAYGHEHFRLALGKWKARGTPEIAPQATLHVSPGLVEQSSKSQRIGRSTRPSAADFVNPPADIATLSPVLRREVGNTRPNACVRIPVLTNRGFVASVSAHLWADDPHV
jgi:hypothetical protein